MRSSFSLALRSGWIGKHLLERPRSAPQPADCRQTTPYPPAPVRRRDTPHRLHQSPSGTGRNPSFHQPALERRKMFLDITNATELPHELQTFMIATAAAADEVNNFSLSEMTHTIPLLSQTPA